MNNTLTVAELKRRGMAAIEEGLKHGPVHILKRNRPTAVVVSEEEYQRLTRVRSPSKPSVTAVQ
ncbi:type II toxin-antitoxin system Phd/YefM family antitoxin [Pseudomonas aeruginosa]|nr:type II toxin-antitoxin system Phd/YefM family antitoxin [Pseudomonas aeruginosa]